MIRAHPHPSPLQSVDPFYAPGEEGSLFLLNPDAAVSNAIAANGVTTAAGGQVNLFILSLLGSVLVTHRSAITQMRCRHRWKSGLVECRITHRNAFLALSRQSPSLRWAITIC